ncbi:MAG: deoxyribonuclease IV [Calditrichia bacterium]
MKYIGAHVSAAGGVQNSVLNARKIGATGFGLFTKNQRQWTAKPLKEEEIKKFRDYVRENNYSAKGILPHDSYLINLGSPDEEKLKKSRAAFLDEMKRCQQLSLSMLNFHPGAHLNLASESECIDIICESINQALDATEGVTAVIETTAGQGSAVGYKFEHLRDIIKGVNDSSRVGVCVDTCHIFAAGYDLGTRKGYEETIEEFDRIVGLQFLKAFHINDSKKKQGSRVDRHAPLGDGFLGWEPFSWIMQDDRFDGIAFILETPEPDRWPEEIQKLKQMAGEL